jgi:hypothetical protein
MSVPRRSQEPRQFWHYQRCREFIQSAIEQYKHAPGWFTTWLDDLYMRLGDERHVSITLDEIETLCMLAPNGEHAEWEPEHYAVNRVYKFFDRTGRDTTGIIGY